MKKFNLHQELSLTISWLLKAVKLQPHTLIHRKFFPLSQVFKITSLNKFYETKPH